MKQREFRIACAEEFGEAYSGVLIRDHWLSALEGTASDALQRGVAVRDIWLALCDDLDVPAARRYGRGLLEPSD